MIVLFANIFLQVLDPEFRKPFQNVTRWFLTLVNQPQFKTVIGDVTLASKMAQFDGMLSFKVLKS